MSVRDDLIAAKEAINTPEKWTKGAYHRTSYGKLSYCILGALMCAAPGAIKGEERRMAMVDALFEFIPGPPHCNLPEFNDAPGTSHWLIMEVFNRAIEAAS